MTVVVVTVTETVVECAFESETVMVAVPAFSGVTVKVRPSVVLTVATFGTDVAVTAAVNVPL
jgi:hypothetical protein